MRQVPSVCGVKEKMVLRKPLDDAEKKQIRGNILSGQQMVDDLTKPNSIGRCVNPLAAFGLALCTLPFAYSASPYAGLVVMPGFLVGAYLSIITHGNPHAVGGLPYALGTFLGNAITYWLLICLVRALVGKLSGR